MRIALVHSFYSQRSPSGENIVVEEQASALADAGHEVAIIGRSTDDLSQEHFYTARAAIAVATGRGASPVTRLRDFAPDIVHIHNLFPNWGRTWLSRWDGPLVSTVHNFRPMCAAGTLYRSGAECRLCATSGSWNAVKYRCYRDSAAASVPLAISTRRGAARDPLLVRADRIVTLSPRSLEIYLESGLPRQKLSMIPNFVLTNSSATTSTAGAAWAYVGRLTTEKGVLDLIHAWPNKHRLHIYGDGPLRAEVASATQRSPSIEYMGRIPRRDVAAVLTSARGVVVPSLWAEGAAPLSYVESLAAGRPVIALDGNAAADDIASSGAGRVIATFRELPEAIELIEFDWQKYAESAQRRYEEAFGVAQWLTRTERMYRELIELRGANR